MRLELRIQPSAMTRTETGNAVAAARAVAGAEVGAGAVTKAANDPHSKTASLPEMPAASRHNQTPSPVIWKIPASPARYPGPLHAPSSRCNPHRHPSLYPHLSQPRSRHPLQPRLQFRQQSRHRRHKSVIQSRSYPALVRSRSSSLQSRRKHLTTIVATVLAVNRTSSEIHLRGPQRPAQCRALCFWMPISGNAIPCLMHRLRNNPIAPCSTRSSTCSKPAVPPLYGSGTERDPAGCA